MVCHCSVPDVVLQPDATVFHSTQTQPAAAILHPAQAMTPPQRRRLALAALTGDETVSGLAREHQVSRKFVYHQAGKADEALDEAFAAGGCGEPGEDRVLFYLPVTKAWLRQLILGLMLICHSSLRGVVE